MHSVTVEGLYDAHESNPEVVARLPGEELTDPANYGPQEPSETASEELVADRRGRSRKPATSNTILYAGVGLVALLMAGGYIFLRPSIVTYPSQPTQARIIHQTGVAPVGLVPLAPSATLANVPARKLPPVILHQKYVPQSPSTELSELDRFQAGTAVNTPGTSTAPLPANPGAAAPRLQQASMSTHPPASAHAAPPGPGVSSGLQAPRAASLPHAPPSPTGNPATYSGSRPNMTHPLAQKLFTAVASPPVVEPGGQTAEPTSLALVTATQVAAPPTTAASPGGAQANTLSPTQQTQLFQLVTDLATMERDDRLREAVLTGEVEQLSRSLTNVLADYNRRLSILEAQTAVSGAMQAGSTNAAVTAAIGSSPVSASSAPVAPVAPGAQAMAAPAPAATPAALAQGTPASTVQYHVQAASPGLAMLSVVGGDTAPLEVQVGDKIPGYGKVTAVVQQGDSWVVQTQDGNIE